MELAALTALSPLDGRYHTQTSTLANYFSEYALIKYRVLVEVRYLTFLTAKGFFSIPGNVVELLNGTAQNFSIKDAEEIKQIEQTTAHDVKAVEYFVKRRLQHFNAGDLSEWVHFGLTSQDINNTAFPLMWQDALTNVFHPQLNACINKLQQLALEWKEVPMLARTHGQPASPTLLGKEFQVYVERLQQAISRLKEVPVTGKFGGATGNFNAHQVAFPRHDWPALADEFLKVSLGLKRQQFTTQIEHYDNLAAGFDAIKRINTIFIDLCRDVWSYISMDYFTQTVKAGEVGSSAMPHKVNPIDFENAEGNLGLANALLEHLSAKLPVSRLQRDLTDSTVLRNIGVPLGHSLIACTALLKGLNKLVLNPQKLNEDLDQNWAVTAEAIQTILRRESYPNPYEVLKALTRGATKINKEKLHAFIDGLSVSSTIKEELKAISPHNYTGVHPSY